MLPIGLRTFTLMICSIAIVFSLPSKTKAQQPEEMREMMEEFHAKNRKRMQLNMQMQQLMQMLGNEDMRKELAIVPDQVEKLREIVQEFQKVQMKYGMKNQQHQKEIQRLFQSKQFEEAIELAKKMNADFDQESGLINSQVETTLLPHQTERLRQIAKQQSLKYATPYRDRFGMALALGRELELTPEEMKKLEEKIVEVRSEYYAKIEELNKKANEEILGSLPVEKRDKIKSLIGDYYDHEKQQRKQSEARHRDHQERMRQQRERERERQERENR